MKTTRYVLLSAILLLELFALPAQYYLVLKSMNFAILPSFINLLSYFTILSNFLVALCCAAVLFRAKSRMSRWLGDVRTVSAIAVYITVVGIVFNIALRPILELEGLGRITSEVFHLVVPILYLCYWFLVWPIKSLMWSHVLKWQLFPLFYVLYIIVRGHFTNFYPYPFIDVTQLGYPKAMLNGAFVLLLIGGLSCIAVGAAKLISNLNERIVQVTSGESQSINPKNHE